jgi:rod shape-determining protein MreC
MARASGGASRLDTGLLLACLALSVFALAVPSRLSEPSASAIRRTVLSPLIEIERRASKVRAAIDARDSVLMSRGRTATDELSSRAIVEENTELRQLLGLASRLKGEYVVAEVIAGRASEDQYSIVLSAGSASGIQPMTPVVTADGLVGMVRTTDATTSIALMWAHPDFAVSAMSADKQALGIVKPHLGSGAERWLLEMRGVAFRSKLDTGTLIVTAGLGVTYPLGIPVGTVIGEITTTEKWARTYLLRPAVPPSSIGPVIVMLPSKVAQGVNTVWANIASADSAARAVAVAGDSLARIAALDELAARRAAIDSTVADSLARDSLGRPLQTAAPGIRSARADSIRRDSARRADSIRARARADSIRRAPTGPPPAPPRTGPPPPEFR